MSASEKAKQFVGRVATVALESSRGPSSWPMEEAQERALDYIAQLERVAEAAREFTESSEADGWTCLHPLVTALAALRDGERSDG